MNLRVIRANLVVSIKSFYREKTVVFFRLAFPVILILVFGTIFMERDNEIFDLDVQDLDQTKSSAQIAKAIGLSGRFKIRSMRFPRYMLVMTPQKRSGCSVIRVGPGCMPCIISAPRRMAITALAGIPNVNKGMKAPAVAALFADSGPATPAIAPFPNCSGWRETFRSMA